MDNKDFELLVCPSAFPFCLRVDYGECGLDPAMYYGCLADCVLSDVAKAIIRRFVDAMANRDHNFSGYDLCTFANSASYIGTVNHANLDHTATHSAGPNTIAMSLVSSDSAFESLYSRRQPREDGDESVGPSRLFLGSTAARPVQPSLVVTLDTKFASFISLAQHARLLRRGYC